MELLERAKTWWETLGITAKEAALVDNAIAEQMEKVRPLHPLCQNCNNRIDPKSFHDCCGVYDEVRFRLGDTLARSTRNRLMRKYGCEWDEMSKMVDMFFANNAHRTPQLIKEVEQLRKNDSFRQTLLQINWDIEEELWNS